MAEDQYPSIGDVTISIGSTGLKRDGGYVSEEWLPQLRGINGVRIYTEMRDNDSITGALIYVIKSLISQTKFHAVAANKTNPRAAEAAEFLESCIADMDHTWQDFMSEVCSMLPFGWAYFEKVFKYRNGMGQPGALKSRHDDGKLGWKKISLRAQDSLLKWEIDAEGDILGMWQQTYPDFSEAFLPIAKCLLFRTSAEKNSPEGRSILRNAYRAWHFLKRVQELEAIGIERELCGLPVLECPVEIMNKNASGDQQALKSELAQLLQQIRRDQREGVLIPSELSRDGKPTGYKLRLLSTGGKRQIDVNTTIKRYESRIAMTVLAEFLMLGQDAHGSFALASSKTDVFAVALGALIDNITETFNRHAVAQLMELNGYEPEVWPKLCHGDIESPSLDELGTYIDKLGGKNFLRPTNETEAYLREQAGLPAIPSDMLEVADRPLPTPPAPLVETPAPATNGELYA